MDNNTNIISNPHIGDRVTFTTTGEENGETLTVLLVELKAGGGNSLHYHKWLSERFEVISGTLGLQLGKDNLELTPGNSFTVTPGIDHRFYNPSEETCVFHIEIRPGKTRFELCLKVLYGLATEGKTNRRGIPNPMVSGLIYLWGGTNLGGAFRIFEPLLYVLGRFSQLTGYEANLIARYS